MFKKIINLGIEEEYPAYLKQKIAISNMVALVIAFLVALPFVFISLIFFPPLAYLPIIAIPIALTTLLFNSLRMHTLARIVISLVPISLASVYQAYLSNEGQAVTPGLALIMLSFSFVIFVIFDLREKAMMITMSTVMLVIMLLMDPMNDALEMELDTQVIETGFLAKMVVVISIVSSAGCILILAFQNRDAEQKAFELVRQSEVNQENMAAKEKELKDNLAKLEEAQKEESRRQWINEGLTKGMVIIRNQPDIKKLGDEIVSFVVRYVKANQGGLFLVNEDNPEDPFLELVSAYAFERKKHIQKRVEIGNGLLGQAYLEKNKVYLKVIPRDYVHITSGLGTAPPATVLIVPLKINGVIPAMIELASFREFQDHEIHFIETFGENIASYLQSAKINATTQNLLTISQQQTEEMRAQEEEMRQNMEELSATQEEMVRKEREYLRRIEELEKSLVTQER